MTDGRARGIDTASGPPIPIPDDTAPTVCRACRDGIHEQCDGTEPLRRSERGYLAPPLATLVCRCHRRDHEPEADR